ncbi:3-deoxy-7-phosphoheptulonate synthase, partial [Erythrobacter sp. YJ-T3-07]|uniref:3-deoxy-7-phosphoheptulonate synthase n=1 Tax=Erythrobacter sp. YJ-T3-07 TaxID=2793063 RepID=UPI001F1B4C03
SSSPLSPPPSPRALASQCRPARCPPFAAPPLPASEDSDALALAEAELAACPSLVFAGASDALLGELARVEAGQAVLLPGLACAESFAAFARMCCNWRARSGRDLSQMFTLFATILPEFMKE